MLTNFLKNRDQNGVMKLLSDTKSAPGMIKNLLSLENYKIAELLVINLISLIMGNSGKSNPNSYFIAVRTFNILLKNINETGIDSNKLFHEDFRRTMKHGINAICDITEKSEKTKNLYYFDTWNVGETIL